MLHDQKCHVNVEGRFLKCNGLVGAHLGYVFGSKEDAFRGPLRNVGVHKEGDREWLGVLEIVS